MDFYDIVRQVLELLQRDGRTSYRALKRQFDLDDEALDDLKEELRFAHPVIDEDGRGLIWTGGADANSVTTSPSDRPLEPPNTQEALSASIEAPSSEPPAPDAERRQLTVMFCDLVDSTRLSGQLDPEDLRDVIRAYQSTSAEVIERYDGYIAQHLGDGLMVYFGWPQAHEDDARRAVHAGVGILKAMQGLNVRLKQEKDICLAVRIGIHTGLVVVGEVGQGASQEHLAMGETPNIASRIEGIAERDSVAISEATHQLVEGYFECEDMGRHILKGVDEAQHMYRVLRSSGAQSRLDVVAARGLTPLVGRESEVTLLFDRWQRVKEGQGRVILLSGDAGIGKSRLLQVMKDHVRSEAHMLLECRSSPYYQNTALYPITDMLQRVLNLNQDETPEAKLDRLERTLHQYPFELDEAIPLFATLLSLPIPEHRYPQLNLSPQRQRQKTLAMIVAMLLQQAEAHPVLFILEDLHWTDPSTLEMLELLIDQTPTTSICLLLTGRPSFRPPWGVRSYLTQITLNHLSRSQIAQMVERVASGKRLPAEVVQQIVEKTDGVPLFVEEMVKAILESGVLKETNAHYELAASFTTLAIPATLQDSLMSRLDRLINAKAVAQYAAVIGRQFSYVLLKHVSQLDEGTLQHELTRLVDAELIYQRGLLPQATYTFKHALIQDTAYQSLLKSTRQHIHRRLVQVLEEQFPEIVEMHPELLAQHAFQGEVWDKALLYARQSGVKAMTHSAYHEAVVGFEQALAVLQRLPDHRETQEQAVDLRFELRNALIPIADHQRILAHLREAETQAEALNDHVRLGQACIFTSRTFMVLGMDDESLEAIERAQRVAAASGDMVLRIMAGYRLGLLCHTRTDYQRGIEVLRQSVASLVGARPDERFGIILPPPIMSHAYLGNCLAHLGAFAEAIAEGEEAVRLVKTIDHPYAESMVHRLVGEIYLCKGELPKATLLIERARQCGHSGNFESFTAALLSNIYALYGRNPDALAMMEEAGQPLYRAEAYLRLGCTAKAHDLAQQFLELNHTRKRRGYQAQSLRQLGDITMHCDFPDVDQAETYYQQALTLANELDMRPLQAHCHRGLGTLYSQIGLLEQAYAELSTVIDMYREMEMTFWLPETEAALAEVEGKA